LIAARPWQNPFWQLVLSDSFRPSNSTAGNSALGRVPPNAVTQTGHKTTPTILETRLDHAETGARLRSESDTRCLVSRATRCCVPHPAARHLIRRSLAKCSRYRLVNLQREARFNIGHCVAKCKFQMRVA
jgi:hypothetical protein